MRLGFALRKLEQAERALDVDLMRGQGRELGAGRQQCGEMIDRIDLELRENAIEQARIVDRSGELALHVSSQRRIERIQIQRHDRVTSAGDELFD